MKNNGKMTAAFIITGLLALLAGVGGMALIWYAGDLDRYYYHYSSYLIAIGVVALVAWVFACCSAAALSVSNRRKYQELTTKIKEYEGAAVVNNAEKTLDAEKAAVEAEKEPIAKIVSEPSVFPEKESAEAVIALHRIQEYVVELKSVAKQVEKQKDVKTGLEGLPFSESLLPGQRTSETTSIIDEIDDIAFRAHLLSLNIEIERSNAKDATMDLTSIAEEVKGIETKSASVASKAGALLGAGKNENSSSTETTEKEYAEKLKKIASIAEDIEQAANKITDDSPDKTNPVDTAVEKAVTVSPIDTQNNTGLFQG